METVSAAEASRQLGVSLATLYAYVSRGLIRSAAVRGSRQRRYSADDVSRMNQRKELRRDPGRELARALHWGAPILDSSITLIRDQRLFYRGHDAIALAAERSVEEVASLIWTGELTSVSFSNVAAVRGSGRLSSAVGSAQIALAQAALRDPRAFDLRPAALPALAAQIVTLLAAAMSGGSSRADIASTLVAAWKLRQPKAVDVIRAALILCADHELNISSFTARCVASAGSSPYAVVGAALAAAQGVKHGGLAPRVENLFDEVSRHRSARATLSARLQRGEDIPGFGHPLYPDGDPRARAILALLPQFRSPELPPIRRVSSAALELLGEHPSIDFALAAAARVLGLPRESSLTLFVIGRSIGWMGHAIEQYSDPGTIRPRARYTGPPPLD